MRFGVLVTLPTLLHVNVCEAYSLRPADVLTIIGQPGGRQYGRMPFYEYMYHAQRVMNQQGHFDETTHY